MRKKGKKKARSGPALRTGRQSIGKSGPVPSDPLVRDQEIQIGKRSEQTEKAPTGTLQTLDFIRKVEEFGRGEWIRTTDLLVPNQAL